VYIINPRYHKHPKTLIEVTEVYAWLQPHMVQRSFKVPWFYNAPPTNKHYKK